MKNLIPYYAFGGSLSEVECTTSISDSVRSYVRPFVLAKISTPHKSAPHGAIDLIVSGSVIKMISGVEDDCILQVSSQEPSMSSKYDFEDGGS